MPACISNDTVWPLGPIMQRAGFLHLPMTALNSLVTQGHTEQAYTFLLLDITPTLNQLDFVLLSYIPDKFLSIS